MTEITFNRAPFPVAWAAICGRCGWLSPSVSGPEVLPTSCPVCTHRGGNNA